MKPPTFAPFFACLYPSLAEVARKNGYALAIHGSVVTDLDLIAVPWTDFATDSKKLLKDLTEHIGANGYDDLLYRQGFTREQVEQIMSSKKRDETGMQVKPHGRMAWNIYLDSGAKVDLSFMPLKTTVSEADAVTKYEEISKLYHELIYEVGTVHDGESRHETAKRYIRERENSTSDPHSKATEKPIIYHVD